MKTIIKLTIEQEVDLATFEDQGAAVEWVATNGDVYQVQTSPAKWWRDGESFMQAWARNVSHTT